MIGVSTTAQGCLFLMQGGDSVKLITDDDDPWHPWLSLDPVGFLASSP